MYKNLGIKFILFISFALVFQFASGQHRTLSDGELNKSTLVKMKFADTIRNCEAMDNWFKQDVENKTIFLFLEGGIVPTVYTKDKAFESKYKVFIEDFGCTGPDIKCIIRYNNNSFNYLTGLYGKNWTKEIRKDVIGLAEWKKNYKN